MKNNALLLVILVGLLLSFLMPSCVARVNPDGSREYRADPDLFLRAVEIHASRK